MSAVSNRTAPRPPGVTIDTLNTQVDKFYEKIATGSGHAIAVKKVQILGIYNKIKADFNSYSGNSADLLPALYTFNKVHHLLKHFLFPKNPPTYDVCLLEFYSKRSHLPLPTQKQFHEYGKRVGHNGTYLDFIRQYYSHVTETPPSHEHFVKEFYDKNPGAKFTVFLPDNFKNAAVLQKVVTKLNKAPEDSPHQCWQLLVDGIFERVRNVLLARGSVTPAKLALHITYSKVRQVLRLHVITPNFESEIPAFFGTCTPNETNLKIFNAYRKAFGYPGLPMQFAINDALERLEKAAYVAEDMKSLLPQLKAFGETYQPVLKEHLQRHPELQKRYAFLRGAIDPNFFQRLMKHVPEEIRENKLAVAAILGNIYIAHHYGFLPSLIAGVSSQSLLYCREARKLIPSKEALLEGVKLGAGSSLLVNVPSVLDYASTLVPSYVKNLLGGLNVVGLPVAVINDLRGANGLQGRLAVLPKYALSFAGLIWQFFPSNTSPAAASCIGTTSSADPFASWFMSHSCATA